MKFKNSKEFTIQDQKLYLLPQKAVLWKDKRVLIISDLHLGKSGHFRKHGIAVPENVNQSNIERLDDLMMKYHPEKLVFLGDLFHSKRNNEVEQFEDWRKSHASTEMILTIGNHDLLTQFEFEKMGLTCVNQYQAGPFLFLHDDALNDDSSFYSISGHIHPAVKLKAKGRQNIYTPCFYFGKGRALLPAFGAFTGNYRIKPAQNDSVFAVVEQKVIDISSII